VWNRPEKGALAQWVLALEELAVKLKIAAAGPPNGAGMTVGIWLWINTYKYHF